MSTERNADDGADSKGNGKDEGSRGEGGNGGNGQDATIVVNGRERTITEKDLGFDAVAALGFETVPTGENVLLTITFRRGHGNKPEGNLLPGGLVKIKDGMVFVVTATDKS